MFGARVEEGAGWPAPASARDATAPPRARTGSRGAALTSRLQPGGTGGTASIRASINRIVHAVARRQVRRTAVAHSDIEALGIIDIAWRDDVRVGPGARTAPCMALCVEPDGQPPPPPRDAQANI